MVSSGLLLHLPSPGQAETPARCPQHPQPSDTSCSERQVSSYCFHCTSRGKNCSHIIPTAYMRRGISQLWITAPHLPDPSRPGGDGQLRPVGIPSAKQLWEAVYLPARLVLLALMSHISS